jgi:hypothetical protein
MAPKRKITDEVWNTVDKLRAEGHKWDSVSIAVGISGDHLRKSHKKRMAGRPLVKQVESEMELETDIPNPKIHSLLAQAEVNLDEWEPQRAVVNRWGPEDFAYQAKVWLKYIPEVGAIRRAKDDLIADVQAAYDAMCQDIEYLVAAPPEEACLLEVSGAEPHLGKLGWTEEVMDTYDLQIACDRYKRSIKELVRRATAAHSFDKILYVYGNDFMHIDSKISTTTAGTFQDTDTRWHKIFRTAHQLAMWTIMLLREIAPVDVMVIAGNHDELSTFAVGEVLNVAFDNDPNVTVYNTAALRKYYAYGNTLLGFAHGGAEKHTELPAIMADEAAEHWAGARFREWHIGHRHNKKKMDFNTFDQFRTTAVRILPSLCGNDYWHYRHGYRHHPQSEAYVWTKNTGMSSLYTYTDPAMFTGEKGETTNVHGTQK